MTRVRETTGNHGDNHNETPPKHDLTLEDIRKLTDESLEQLLYDIKNRPRNTPEETALLQKLVGEAMERASNITPQEMVKRIRETFDTEKIESIQTSFQQIEQSDLFREDQKQEISTIVEKLYAMTDLSAEDPSNTQGTFFMFNGTKLLPNRLAIEEALKTIKSFYPSEIESYNIAMKQRKELLVNIENALMDIIGKLQPPHLELKFLMRNGGSVAGPEELIEHYGYSKEFKRIKGAAKFAAFIGIGLLALPWIFHDIKNKSLSIASVGLIGAFVYLWSTYGSKIEFVRSNAFARMTRERIGGKEMELLFEFAKDQQKFNHALDVVSKNTDIVDPKNGNAGKPLTAEDLCTLTAPYTSTRGGEIFNAEQALSTSDIINRLTSNEAAGILRNNRNNITERMQKAAQYEYTNIRAGNTQMTPNEVVAKINTIFSPLGVEFIGISDETIAMIRNDHMTSGVIDERKAVPPEIAKLFIGLPPSHVRELLRAIQKTNHDPKGRDSMIASAKANRESNGQAFDEIRQTVISTQPLPNDDPNT